MLNYQRVIASYPKFGQGPWLAHGIPETNTPPTKPTWAPGVKIDLTTWWNQVLKYIAERINKNKMGRLSKHVFFPCQTAISGKMMISRDQPLVFGVSQFQEKNRWQVWVWIDPPKCSMSLDPTATIDRMRGQSKSSASSFLHCQFQEIFRITV